MSLKLLRKYGVESTLNFGLFIPDGTEFKVDAVHVSGDTTIMKDEGAEVNTTNGFTDEGTGYAIVLTATEMQAARLVVYIADQTGPKVWLDDYIIIETYGHASAQFLNFPSNVTQWKDTDVPTPDTAGYPISTIKDGTGQGEILLTNGIIDEVADVTNEVLAEADVTSWDGDPVATPDSAGYPKTTVKDGTGQGEISLTDGKIDEVNKTTFDNSAVNRDVIANSLKDRNVSGTGDVTGSIYKDLKTLINAVPASTLAQTVDTETVSNILELTMAMVNGRFKKDVPSVGKITFYKRDNVTPLFIVTVTELERTLDP